jgi:TIR domain
MAAKWPSTSESGYKYDVYISYRRANAWPKFVDSIFMPMFRHWLQSEIGHPPSIFVDVDDIETGEPWPYRLAASLSLSKVMVCLWSTEYFASRWCQAELGQMLARRELTKTDSGPLPLILAAVIHGGENISPHLSNVGRINIQEYANPWLAPGSPRSEALSQRIREFAAEVSQALQKAPAFDPAWRDIEGARFVELFSRQARQGDVPQLGSPVTS